MNILFLFIIGTIAGSFMNVCIYRLPRKESVITPQSHCTSCGATIPWFDNIPLLSFFLLRGRCRFCKKRISARYIIVEILSGLICVLLFLHFGLTPKFFILWYLSSALLVVSFIDLRFREIPDTITLPGIIAGLCVAALYPPLTGKAGHLSSLLDSFLGIIVGGGGIYLVGFIAKLILKKKAMGGGDVKLMAMIGAFVGWKLVLLTFFLACCFGSIVGVPLKIKKGESVIPFGPYLSLGALVAVFYGEKILKEILRRFFSF